MPGNEDTSRDYLEPTTGGPNALQSSASNGSATNDYAAGSSSPINAHKPSMQHFDGNNNALARFATNSTFIPPEFFEKAYLSPENRVSGKLRKTFGNPTPLALMGFLIASTPLACNLMGWRGAGGGGAAIVGVFYTFGGLLQIIGSIMEWILGNTFPFVVFGSYGAFWITLGMTLTPQYNAMAAYTTTSGNALAPGSALSTSDLAAGTAEFDASFGFYLIFIGLLSFFYIICAVRINVIFVIIFVNLDTAVFLLAGSYFKNAAGDTVTGAKLQIASGAFIFVYCIFAWYLLLAQLLQSMDFAFELPVFDLSTVVKGKKQIQRERKAREENGEKMA